MNDPRTSEHAVMSLREAARIMGVSHQTALAAERNALRKLRGAVWRDAELLQTADDLFGDQWRLDKATDQL